MTLRFWDHAGGAGKALNGTCSDYHWTTSWGATGDGTTICSGGGNTVTFRLPASASPGPGQKGSVTVFGTAHWPSASLAAKLNRGHVASGRWTQALNGGSDLPTPSPASSPPPPSPTPDPSPAASPCLATPPAC